MTTPPSFPTLPGLTWNAHKKPTFSTIVAPHVSGREVRYQNYVNPIWNFELTIEGMDSTNFAYPGLGANSQQALLALALELGGSFGVFLYTDPSDNAVSGGAIATGDGTTTTFTLTRGIGSLYEPVGWVTALSAVYFNGTAQSNEIYSLTTPNSLVFQSAPSSGVAITASFTFAFQCRFSDDDMDFNNIMEYLWEVGSVKFKSLRPNYP